MLGRFSELDKLLPSLDVDVALLDAGCSSMQMDLADRGFSLSKDGPLDMRMDGDRFDCYLLSLLFRKSLIVSIIPSIIHAISNA